jgi:phage terminase large subunit-like protein
MLNAHCHGRSLVWSGLRFSVQRVVVCSPLPRNYSHVQRRERIRCVPLVLPILSSSDVGNKSSPVTQNITQSHPYAPLPETPEQKARFVAALGGHDKARAFMEARAARLAQAEEDPLRYGWETQTIRQLDGSEVTYLPHWKIIRDLYGGRFTHNGVTYPPANDILLLGGKRASKTEPAAKLAVEALYTRIDAPVFGTGRPLIETPHLMDCDGGRTVWCWIMDETSSIDRQQSYVYQFLPPEHRDMGKKGVAGNIKFGSKTGFSERCLILPGQGKLSASKMRFFTYHQFRQDPDVAEGAETDFIWLDEPPPEDLVETLRFRNQTKGGKLLLTFNPKNGYTAAVAQYLEGAQLLMDMPARWVPKDEVWVPGCRPGHMPVVLRCHASGRWVVVAFTENNPFNVMARVEADALALSPSKRKMHVYGWPERMAGVAAPAFGDVHILDPEAVPKVGTRYVVVDPTPGGRNWFMTWFIVDERRRRVVYREWPDSSYGEWALPGKKPNGTVGPAQTMEAGQGVAFYKRVLLEQSGWTRNAETGDWERGQHGEEIEEIIGDPRGFGAQVLGQDESTSLYEQWVEVQKDREGKIVGPAMDLVTSDSVDLLEGITLVNSWLEYDRTQPLSMANCPKLYVSRRCPNTIYSLRTWTGQNKDGEANKDPWDTLRYAAKMDIDFCHVGGSKVSRQGAGGY